MLTNGETHFFEKIHQPLNPEEKKQFEDEFSENIKDTIWEIHDRGRVMRLGLEAYAAGALINKCRILVSRLDKMGAILGNNYADKTISEIYILGMQILQVRMSIEYILSLLSKRGVRTPRSGKFEL